MSDGKLSYVYSASLLSEQYMSTQCSAMSLMRRGASCETIDVTEKTLGKSKGRRKTGGNSNGMNSRVHPVFLGLQNLCDRSYTYSSFSLWEEKKNRATK